MCCIAAFIVKYVLFIANLLFTLAGVGLIVVGALSLSNFSGIQDLLPPQLSGLAIGIIVVGSIIFLIAFLGCCGAIKESTCLLISYAVCMAILAAAKIYLATQVFNNLSNLQGTVTEWIEDAFNDPELTNYFHDMETALECCGTTGPGSYSVIPPSCCPVSGSGAVCVAENAFGGCIDRLTGFLETIGGAAGGILITVIVVELVAVVFGIFLSCNIRKPKQNQAA